MILNRAWIIPDSAPVNFTQISRNHHQQKNLNFSHHLEEAVILYQACFDKLSINSLRLSLRVTSRFSGTKQKKPILPDKLI